jgi:hypothetical protein
MYAPQLVQTHSRSVSPWKWKQCLNYILINEQCKQNSVVE